MGCLFSVWIVSFLFLLGDYIDSYLHVPERHGVGHEALV